MARFLIILPAMAGYPADHSIFLTA